MLSIESHPLLDVVAFTTTFAGPIAELTVSDALSRLLVRGVDAPLRPDDAVRAAVRDLLRHGGYKPTGRGKPASEYLVRAADERTLGSINAAVDACNAVSLHSGLPISVVDRDRAADPLRIAIAPPGSSYVFNASGQEIDVAGLVVLADAEGPCAGPVKDSHRTKTHAGTTRTLSVIWGTRALPGRAAAAATWYRKLLAGLGATTDLVI
ncbi:MAG: phenylalanine--tRNA ligase beta subunit-related protein [Byssovorax sp.]